MSDDDDTIEVAPRWLYAATSDDEDIIHVAPRILPDAARSGMDAASISAWAKNQSEVKDPDDPNPLSGSSARAPVKIELHFLLPCGQGQPFSRDEDVVHDTSPKLKMKQIQNNPSSLDAFISGEFNDEIELHVHFRLARSESETGTRGQLKQCLNALLQLTKPCSFVIDAEYTPAANNPKEIVRADGTVITLRDTIVSRLKQLAGTNRQLTILDE